MAAGRARRAWRGRINPLIHSRQGSLSPLPDSSGAREREDVDTRDVRVLYPGAAAAAAAPECLAAAAERGQQVGVVERRGAPGRKTRPGVGGLAEEDAERRERARARARERERGSSSKWRAIAVLVHTAAAVLPFGWGCIDARLFCFIALRRTFVCWGELAWSRSPHE